MYSQTFIDTFQNNYLVDSQSYTILEIVGETVDQKTILTICKNDEKIPFFWNVHYKDLSQYLLGHSLDHCKELIEYHKSLFE